MEAQHARLVLPGLLDHFDHAPVDQDGDVGLEIGAGHAEELRQPAHADLDEAALPVREPREV
jgi:hypothetical protein